MNVRYKETTLRTYAPTGRINERSRDGKPNTREGDDGTGASRGNARPTEPKTVGRVVFVRRTTFVFRSKQNRSLTFINFMYTMADDDGGGGGGDDGDGDGNTIRFNKYIYERSSVNRVWFAYDEGISTNVNKRIYRLTRLITT